MLTALRRSGAAARLLARCEPSSVVALQQQLGQRAGYAKKGESVDSRLQKVLKMLEPREVEEVELSKEDYEEGVRRCAWRVGVGGGSGGRRKCRRPLDHAPA